MQVIFLFPSRYVFDRLLNFIPNKRDVKIFATVISTTISSNLIVASAALYITNHSVQL